MQIEINNLTNFKINKRSFSQVAKKVLSGENRETETFSLAFVSEGEIKKLNKKFRRKDKPTDVLSFEISNKGGSVIGRDYLGEVVVCPEYIMKDAPKYTVKPGKELEKVFIHGVLHLLGYDHEKGKSEAKKMADREDFYLNKV